MRVFPMLRCLLPVLLLLPVWSEECASWIDLVASGGNVGNVSSGIGHSTVIDCHNLRYCVYCCPSYVMEIGKDQSCPDNNPAAGAKGHSSVNNLNGRFRHFADDYVAEPTIGPGCAPCGAGTSLPDATKSLERLALRRVYYPDAGFYGSLGFQWGLNVDIWLTIHAPGYVPPYIPQTGWVIEASQPTRNPNDADLYTDDDEDGVFEDATKAAARNITLYDASWNVVTDPLDATQATLTAWTGEVYTFELYEQSVGNSPIYGRIQSMTDRNGNAVTWTWQYAIDDATLTSSSLRTKLRQIDTITDAYGRTATFHYQSTQVGGYWVVESIDLPNGEELGYSYGSFTNCWGGTSQALIGATLPDGSAVTISSETDAALSCLKVTFNDPGDEPTARNKVCWLSKSQWTNPDDSGDIRNQIFGRLRLAHNGAGEQTYAMFQQPYSGEVHSYIIDHGRAYGIVHAYGDVPSAVYQRDDLSGDVFSWIGETWDSGWTKTSDWEHTSARAGVTSRIDGNGNETAYVRDATTNAATTITYPDLSFDERTFNDFLQVTAETDRLGRESACTYDSAGNMLSKRVAVGTAAEATRTFTYWSASDTDTEKGKPGQMKTATDANGNVTEYFYYATGDLKRVVEPADEVSGPRATRNFTWDGAGRLDSIEDPDGRTVAYDYDERNRVTLVTYDDTSTETITYGSGSASNVVVARTDRNGNETTFAYDAAGRLTTTTEAAGTAVAVTTTRTYVAGTMDHIASETRHGEVTTSTYDARQRRTATARQARSGVTLTSEQAYDNANRAVVTTDPYDRRTFLVYDENDRVVRVLRELVPGGYTGSTTQAGLAAVTRPSGSNPAFVITDTVFDAEGQTLARIDGRGIRSTYTYDAQGRMTETVEADALVDTAGVATLLAPPEAARTVTTYDDQGNVTAVDLPRSFARSLPGGAWSAGSEGSFRTSMTYTGRNLRQSVIEADGLDASSQVRAERATTSFTYSLTGKVKTTTDQRSYTTTNYFGVCCDRLVKVTDPSGAETFIGYDHYGNRTSVTDPNGNVTLTYFDARHRVSSTVNGESETTTYTYDDDLTDGVGLDDAYPSAVTGLGFGSGSDGSAVAVTNPANETTLSIHDGLGRTVRSIDPLSNATTITYDTVVSGLVETSQSDPLSHVTATRTDGAGQTRIMIDALTQSSTAAYDANGNRVQSRDPNGIGLDCVFDARNRDTTCTDTAGAVTSKAYDTHGNLVTQTDALSNDTVCTYDARDRKLTCTDRINAMTTFTYDLASNLLTITDAESGGNGVTEYAYDNRNLLIGELFPTGQAGRTQRAYTYDLGRRLIEREVSTIPASGFVETTEYVYDDANRLLTRSYDDSLNDTFTYDAASRLLTATSARYGSTVTRAYDAASRLTSEALDLANGAISGTTVSAATYTVGYDYDDDNRLIEITYPTSSVVERSYTDRNQLDTVKLNTALIADRAYDNAGRLTSTVLSNGLTEYRGYIANDNLIATIAVSGVTDFTYTYDANKRKLSETDGITAANTQTFSYDDQDRLTAWDRPSAPGGDSQSWTLSAVGDWDATTRNSTTEVRTHTDVHELTGIAINGGASVPLSYDAKGNLSGDDRGVSYAWDPENRLATASVPSTASPTLLGIHASYQYDALGRRIAKTVNNRTTVYVCGGAQVLAEYDRTAIPSQAQVDGADVDGTAANAALPPASGGLLTHDLGSVTRVNFQPATSVIPAGYYGDSGTVYGVRSNGLTYGWTVSQSGRQQARGYQTLPEFDTCIRMQPSGGDTPGVWEMALANGAYTVAVVCGDPLSTEQTNNLTIEGQPVIDPDPSVTASYTQGDFDAYAVQVVVSDGKLTIAVGSGAADPKLCLVEISSAWTPTSGTILREWWTGISGTTVASLTGNAAYPFAPTGSATPTLFEAPVNWADNYGTRMRGWVTAPQTGSYTFWIASDDYSELWLSSSANPTAKTQIAAVNDWTSSQQWTKYASQQSASIALVAGESYYIEALQKEASGGDNLAVGWQLPDTTLERPIPGTRLAPWTANDAATDARLAALVAAAADATYAAAQAATLEREYVYGSYGDELLTYVVGVGGGVQQYYVHANHLYSPAAITDSSGVVGERMTYDSYGKQTITSGTGTPRSQSAVGFDRGFTGYILDQETGLYYARERMYSPRAGRFICRDPLRYVNGMNTYAGYFAPNYLDPDGTDVYFATGALIARARNIPSVSGSSGGRNILNSLMSSVSGVGTIIINKAISPKGGCSGFYAFVDNVAINIVNIDSWNPREGNIGIGVATAAVAGAGIYNGPKCARDLEGTSEEFDLQIVMRRMYRSGAADAFLGGNGYIAMAGTATGHATTAGYFYVRKKVTVTWSDCWDTCCNGRSGDPSGTGSGGGSLVPGPNPNPPTEPMPPSPPDDWHYYWDPTIGLTPWGFVDYGDGGSFSPEGNWWRR